MTERTEYLLQASNTNKQTNKQMDDVENLIFKQTNKQQANK